MDSKKVQEAKPTGGRGEGLDGAADSEAARPPKFREFISVGPRRGKGSGPLVACGSVLSDK